MPKSKDRDKLSQSASQFMGLVDVRNRIVHGKPCSAPNGEQKLSSGGIIEINEIEIAADKFAACDSTLNSHYYSFLKDYVSM